MTRLTDMPNLGKTAEKRLQAVGINDAETLQEVGSWEAFARLRLLEGDTCFSTLCGLEGAVKGIRWHHLSKEDKSKLKQYFDTFK